MTYGSQTVFKLELFAFGTFMQKIEYIPFVQLVWGDDLNELWDYQGMVVIKV